MLMNRLFGIVPHIQDFDATNWRPCKDGAGVGINDDVQPPQPTPTEHEEWRWLHHRCDHRADDAYHRLTSMRWQWLSFALCLTFAFGYPYSTFKLLLLYPRDSNRDVDYFITWLYYGAKYLVTIIIYSAQFSNAKKLHAIQMESLCIYRKLCRYLVLHERRWRSRDPQQFPAGFLVDDSGSDSDNDNNAANIDDCDAGDGGDRGSDSVGYRIIECNRHRRRYAGYFAKTLAMIIGYCIVSYSKFVHIFHQPPTMNAFDVACYYYPNLFICMYVIQFSLGIRQHCRIFGKMNNVFRRFMVELNYGVVARRNSAGVDDEEGSCGIGVIAATRTMPRLRRHGERHAKRISASNKLNALISMHDALRRISSALEHIAAVPVVFIIANASMKIVSEVIWKCPKAHEIAIENDFLCF